MGKILFALLLAGPASLVAQPALALPVFSVVQSFGPTKLHANQIAGFRIEVSGLDVLLGAFSVDLDFDPDLLDVSGNVLFGSTLGNPDPLAGESVVGIDATVPGVLHVDQVSLLPSENLEALQRDPATGQLLPTLVLAGFSLAATGATGTANGATEILPTQVVLSDEEGDSIPGIELRGAAIAVPEPGSLALFLAGVAATLMSRFLNAKRRRW